MIALYPGAFKPPHRGHFNVVKSLLDGSYNGTTYNKDNYKEKASSLFGINSSQKPKIDKVIILIGGGERNGIDKQEATAIWEIYAKHLGNVEIVDGQKNPMFAAKDYARENPNEEFVAVTGIRGEEDFVDLRRVTTFNNVDNVQGLALTSAPGSGVRATDFRNSILAGNLDKITDFFPEELSREEILGILTDLKDKIVAEILASNIEGYIDIYFNKEYTINEIGDLSQAPYKWSALPKPKNSSDPYTYYDFTTDRGTKYEVIFNREEFGKTVNYDMSFVAKGKDDKSFSADALTGENEPLKILSTIVDITREQIKKAGDVEFITFEPTKGKTGEEGAKGNTRSKLYKIIIKKNFPKAKVSGTDTVVVDMSAYLGNNLDEAATTPEGKLELKDYITSLLEYMLDKGMNITPLPEIKLRQDDAEASNFFGKTAYYDPNNKEIVLFTLGRHPKDIVRSFSHEMVHHMQNLNGTLGNVQTSNTNEDDHLQELEKEAYLTGNITFRNWEDSLK